MVIKDGAYIQTESSFSGTLTRTDIFGRIGKILSGDSFLPNNFHRELRERNSVRAVHGFSHLTNHSIAARSESGRTLWPVFFCMMTAKLFVALSAV
jgi:hypothetical protein